MGFGYDVVNIGLATTPTTELAVRMSGADGGIIITASHNPRHLQHRLELPIDPNREARILIHYHT